MYVLGNCLDFTDSQYIDVIENYYTNLKDELSQLGKSLPVNKDSEFDLFKDKLISGLATFPSTFSPLTFSSTS